MHSKCLTQEGKHERMRRNEAEQKSHTWPHRVRVPQRWQGTAGLLHVVRLRQPQTLVPDTAPAASPQGTAGPHRWDETRTQCLRETGLRKGKNTRGQEKCKTAVWTARLNKRMWRRYTKAKKMFTLQSMLELIMKDSIPWEGPHAGAG